MRRSPVAAAVAGLLLLTHGSGAPVVRGWGLSGSASDTAQAAIAAPADQDVDALRTAARAALAPVDGEVAIDGLVQPVEVIRDRWGVPHIYASTLEDLFVAQGFVAAQDRLWQLELWKRTAEGTLSEVLGPAAVARDTFARLLRYRGDMDVEWASYSPDARRIVFAFVRGVNAQVAHVLAHPEQLPVEFQLTGTRPSRWTPEVVISRMAGYPMARNADSEVQRAKLAQRLGVARVAEFMPPDPRVPITLPEGLDLSDITDDVLRLDAATEEPIRFSEDVSHEPGAFGLLAPRPPVMRDGRQDAWESVEDRYATIGSNNWVVNGSLTTTGKPLLANDPHRALQLPSLRYTVHLNGPGWNVIGAGEPALPGVAAGHNETVAFGFTIVGIDQQDLYVERLDPANPDQYQYKGAWETMRTEREELRVKGEAPRTLELRFTRHGPVVHVDRARNRAYALRWVGSEPGTAGYLAALSLNVARNWREFLAASARWKVPSENLVYADVEGNIGWIAAGLAPLRSRGNGLLPVPGHEGRFEWQGFLPASELPQAFNPKAGFVATANHNVLPPGYPHVLGYEWAPDHRFRRIVDVLTARRAFTLQDFERLQHDELSIPARTIIDALSIATTVRPIGDRDRAAAAGMLTAWDGVLDQQSPAAALYALWLPRLRRAFADATIASADKPHVPAQVSLERLVSILRRPGPKELDVLTGPSLGEAVAEARERMGDDVESWAWGRIHRAAFEHSLATTPVRAAVMNLPEVPRGGDGSTVNNTGYALRQVHGASFRQVLDLSDWDRSTTINVPGASGQPGSPFYDNWLPRWAAGQYHPLVFSREAVERFAAARLWLRPSDWTDPMPAAAAAAEAPPVLPDFLGSLVNYERQGERIAACMREPGSDVITGARRVPRTFVWVIERDQARQLGSVPGSCDPTWSPDGSRLAAVTSNGLWTYSPTLEDPRQLAEAHLPREPKGEFDYTAFAKPRWSPDGLRIAYLVTNGATSWVEVVEVATGRPLHRSAKDTYSFEWTTDPRVIKVGLTPVRLPR